MRACCRSWPLAWLLGASACADRAEPEQRPVAQAVQAAPAIRLLIATDLEGVLESCGCTSNPVGGIDRLATALAQARAEAIPSLMLVAGNTLAHSGAVLVDGPERQQDLWRKDLLLAALERIGCDVIALGPADFARDHDRLAAFARETRMAVLGATAENTVQASVSDTLDSSALREVGGIRLGISALSLRSESGSRDLRVEAPTRNSAGDSLRAVEREIAGLRRRGAQLVIAVVRAANEQHAQRIAEQTPAEIVVVSNAHDQHASLATVVDRTKLLVYATRHAEGLLMVDVWPAGAAGAAWQLEPAASAPPERTAREHRALVRYRALTRDVPAEPKIRALLEQLYLRVNAHNAQHATAPAAPNPGQASYIGSDSCAACHTQAYFAWQNTRHSHAYETLLARGRQLDLDCIGCHVTGYDRPGGASLAGLDHVKGVGCESCHGPGSTHADNPRPPHRIIRRAVPERVCGECHDAERSDAFDYRSARSALLVPGHGG